MELRQAFGAQVRQHRRAQGLTQEDLAHAVSLSSKTISQIERGVAAPSFETAEAIALALKIPVLFLFGANADTAPVGERGKLLTRLGTILADMNTEQLRRAANLLDAFLGR